MAVVGSLFCVVVKTPFPSENSWDRKKKEKGRGFLKYLSSKGMG